MSVSVMSRVWERAIETMPKMILLKLADHANDDGGSIFPGVESVRVAAGAKSDSTVKRRMRQFRQLGVLVEDDGHAGARGEDAPRTGRGHRKVWRIDLEALAAAFPLAREVEQPPNLTALARAAGDAPEDGEEGDAEEDPDPSQRGAESPPLAPEKGGLQSAGKGGSQDHKGGLDVAPESSRTIKEASTRARAAPGEPPGGDPGGPPDGAPGDPSEVPADPPVNRHWKAGREHFVRRWSEPIALSWWDDLIPVRHDDDGTLVIDVPNQAILDQVRARYSVSMEWALQQAVAQSLDPDANGRLRFVIEGLADKVRRSRRAAAQQQAGKPPGTRTASGGGRR